MKKLLTSILGVASLLVLIPSSMRAQATYTAERTSRIQAGGGLLYLNSDYTDGTIYGASFWGDFDFSRHIGIEVEGHLGSIITPDDLKETS